MADVILSGPLFSPGRDVIVQAEVHRVRHEVSAETQRRTHIVLKARLQNPTGYYQSRILTTNLNPSTDLVNDQRVVYGPWLEGVSRRNQETRFKGYAAFRLAAQTMQTRASVIAEAGAQRIVGRLS